MLTKPVIRYLIKFIASACKMVLQCNFQNTQSLLLWTFLNGGLNSKLYADFVNFMKPSVAFFGVTFCV